MGLGPFTFGSRSLGKLQKASEALPTASIACTDQNGIPTHAAVGLPARQRLCGPHLKAVDVHSGTVATTTWSRPSRVSTSSRFPASTGCLSMISTPFLRICCSIQVHADAGYEGTTQGDSFTVPRLARYRFGENLVPRRGSPCFRCLPALPNMKARISRPFRRRSRKFGPAG